MSRWAAALTVAVLAALGLAVTARGADPEPALLREADLQRDGKLLTRLPLLERLRLFESLPMLESDTPPAPSAPAKETK